MMKRLLLSTLVIFFAFSGLAQSECGELLDSDQNGFITVLDLMNLLSYFGDSDSDLDGIFDSADACTDVSACNYLANPTVACVYPDALGECGGDCAADNDGDGVCDQFYGPCQGESTLIYQDYTYEIVAIGDQCWFAENLRNTHYANGDEIPEELDNGVWSTTTDGAHSVFNEAHLADYGRLYNWFAVDDERGLCPTDWHVSTDVDFIELEMELGMSELEANHTGYRGTDQGTHLKSSSVDSPPWNGSNSTGFSALPAGYRQLYGFIDGAGNSNAGEWCFLWTATLWWQLEYHAFYRRMDISTEQINRAIGHAGSGHSVRCVRD